MNWNLLRHPDQLDIIRKDSFNKPQVIFKHSTHCSISSVAKNRLEKSGLPETIDFHFIDLIRDRPVSNAVSTVFEVEHESPQVLLIMNGQSVFDTSHLDISMPVLTDAVSSAGNNTI